MLVKRATTEECEFLFRKKLERRGHRFEHYKDKYQKPLAVLSVLQAHGTSAGGGTATITGLTTTPGSLIAIVTAQGGSSSATVTVSDSASQSYTQSVSGYAGNSSPSRSSVFYVPNSVALTSITVTWSITTTIAYMLMIEIAGAALSSPEDNSVNASTNSNVTSLTSGNLTTTNPNDILLFCVSTPSTGSGTFTPGGSYIIPANGTNTTEAMEYLIVSSTQINTNTSISWTNAAPATSTFIAFKAAPSAGPSLFQKSHYGSDGMSMFSNIVGD